MSNLDTLLCSIPLSVFGLPSPTILALFSRLPPSCLPAHPSLSSSACFPALLLSQKRNAIPAVDARVFWGGLYLTPALWVLVFILHGFRNVTIVIVALSLVSANIAGYIKCSRDARQRISSFAQSTLASAASHALRLTEYR